MTDNEILTALECLKGYPVKCIECAWSSKYKFPNCQKKIAIEAIDLINRQKAEIEKVKPIHNSFERELECAKQEAIKEFAERLKEKKRFAYAHLGKTHYTVYEEDIDELVQEMVDQQRKEDEGNEHI